MLKLLRKILDETNLYSKTFSKWLPLIYAGYFFVLVLVLSYGLMPGQILPGHSPAEGEVLKITSSFPNLFENFLYWPYYLLVYLLRFIISDGILAARIISNLAALLATASFLLILRRKFGILFSLVSASLFILNSWVLQLARSGTGEMAALAIVFALATALIFIKNYAHSFRLKVVALGAAITSWFMPLAPWLITALFIHIFYRQRVLKKLLSTRLKLSLAISFITLIILAFISFSHEQQDIFIAWGIPENIEGLKQILNNFINTLKSIVWQAPDNPERWLGRLPFLDIFAAAMIPFGFYFVYKQSFGIKQAYLIFTSLGFLIIATLNQGIKTPGIELLLPLIIFVVIGGLHEFLDYWKKIFPLNPLARFLSILIIIVLINMSLFYQVKRYFFAWSQQPQTQEIYNLKSQKD